MAKIKKTILDFKAKEFFVSLLIVLLFFATVLVYPQEGKAICLQGILNGCDEVKSKRCDACYCPDNIPYCPGSKCQCGDACPPTEPTPPPTDPNTECDAKPSAGEKAICYAEGQMGKPYPIPWYGAPTLPYAQWPPPGGGPEYDCWGLVTWAYYWAGKNLPKGTGPGTGCCTQVTGAPQRGDILIWDNFKGIGGHAAISLGGYDMIQSGGDLIFVHHSSALEPSMEIWNSVWRPR